MTKKNSRRLLTPAAVSVLAFAAMLAGAGCGGGGSNQASGGPPPSPTPSSAPSPGSPSLMATPASIDFGAVAVNASASQTVKITNAGSTAAAITQDSLNGAGLSTGLTTPLTLNAGQSLNTQVTFLPGAAGSLVGSFVLSNNGAALLTIPIQGSGVAPVAHAVAISWNASTSPGVQGYNVYRSAVSGGPYAKISPTLAAATLTFTDASPVSGRAYFYIVTAVDGNGVESVASKEVSVTVPTP